MIEQQDYSIPKYIKKEYEPKKNKYCLCIPIINEGEKIHNELEKAMNSDINKMVDIIICDGGSTDNSINDKILKKYGVNTLLIKKGKGKQSAQLRIGFSFALERGYEGIITIDGNNKDSIEDIPKFIEKLDQGYDFIQGSRFIEKGNAINTPWIRDISIKLIHAPLISLTAGEKFTDTTNAYRAYSKKYLIHPEVKPFRNVFQTYELLAYLSVRASQLHLKTCEIPVKRIYPKAKKTPTKISPIKGNAQLLKILFKNMNNDYAPYKNNTNIIEGYTFALQIALLLLFLVRKVNFQVTAFHGRVLGNGLLNNIDVGKRVVFYLGCGILIPLLTYLFGKLNSLILAKLNDKTRGILKYSSLIGSILSLLLFLNLLANNNSMTLKISVCLLLIISVFSFIIMIQNTLSSKKIDTDKIIWMYCIALPLSFIVSLFCYKFNFIIKNMIYTFIIIYLIILLIAKYILKKQVINFNILSKAFLIFMFSPIAESLYLEVYNILNQYNIFLNHKILTLYFLYFILFIISWLYYHFNKKRKIDFDFKKYYYPIILISLALIVTQMPMVLNVNSDFFEQSNNGSAIFELFNYLKIPILENFDAHMLSNEIGSIIYGLINHDYFGSIFIGYNIEYIICIYIIYIILSKFFNRDKAFIISIFIPTMLDYGLYNFAIAFLPVLALINIYNNFSQRNIIKLYLIIIFTCLWRLDLGVPILITSIIMILYIIIKRKRIMDDLKKVIINAVIVIVPLILLYSIICFIKKIDPFTRLEEFLLLCNSNVNWGRSRLGNMSMMSYSLIYFLYPILIVANLIYLFIHRSKYNKTEKIIIFSIGLFYIFNFQRGMIRHNLEEGNITTSISFFYLFISLCVYLYFNRKTNIFCITYILLLTFNSLLNSNMSPNYNNLLDYSISKYLSFSVQNENYDNKINRCKLNDNMNKEYSSLKYVIDKLLENNETFIDLSNQTLLYSLLNRAKPFYINQSPGLLSGEKTQLYFLAEIKSINAPILIKANEKKFSNSLDDILNDYRYYLISEYTFQNYTPIAKINGYEIWSRNDLVSLYKSKLTNIKNNNNIDIIDKNQYYQNQNSNFNLEYIPYIWANNDNAFKSNNRIQYHNDNIVVNQPININNQLINKQQGNYLSLNVSSKKETYITVKLTDDINDYRYCFKILQGDNNYAVRISTIYEWYDNKINVIEIETKDNITINSIKILSGDLEGE